MGIAGSTVPAKPSADKSGIERGPVWAVYFYHIIVSGPDQAARYTKKITAQGQAQHLLAT